MIIRVGFDITNIQIYHDALEHKGLPPNLVRMITSVASSRRASRGRSFSCTSTARAKHAEESIPAGREEKEFLFPTDGASRAEFKNYEPRRIWRNAPNFRRSRSRSGPVEDRFGQQRGNHVDLRRRRLGRHGALCGNSDFLPPAAHEPPSRPTLRIGRH